MSDYQRGVLALRMKPIIEARAFTRQLSTLTQNTAVSPNSDERTLDIFTADAQPTAPAIEPAAPIRTDAAVASLANLGKDTIRKIEQIEQQAAPARTKQQKKQRQRLFTVTHAPTRGHRLTEIFRSVFTVTHARSRPFAANSKITAKVA